MATHYPIKVTLKGGKQVELRPMEPRDEEGLIAFFSGLPEESTQFLKDEVKDPEVARTFVRELNPERVWPILAFADGKVVGDATLHMHLFGWKRHVGEVRVVIAPGYQKQRLATTLIHELVNQAILARTPFGRFGKPEELVGATLFLASAKASGFVTGISIPVDGGYLIHNI